MKICQVIYSGFGGLGSVAFSLAAADLRRENQWLIGFIGDQRIDPSYPDRCAALGIEWAAFQSVSGKPYRAWWNLARWLGREKPDAILLHSINSILPCRWYAWRRGARLVAIEHTPNAVKTGREWVFSRLSMLLADRVVVLTPEYRDELAKAHGWLYRPTKVSVVSNGIDTDVFCPAETPGLVGQKRLRLGMAARFSFSKRQELLVAVLERLTALRPDLFIELAFAGDGTELERVRALAAVSPVAERIRFDGLLSEARMPDWLRGLDIYLHATDGETLSTSLLQAMATGLPIIASDIPGVRNLLGGRGEYGDCVANEGDAFARAVVGLIESPKQAREQGMRGRARVCDVYSNQVMLRNYLAVLHDAGR